MRITVIDEAPAQGRRTVSSLLERGSGDLAESLASLGHAVDRIKVRPASSRARARSASSDRVTEDPRSGVRLIATAPGRELAAIQALAPDAILAVGLGAGRLLETSAADVRAPWVWTTATESLSEVARRGAIPRTAERIIVALPSDSAILTAAGVPRGATAVVPWQLSMHDAEQRSPRSLPRRPSVLLSVADDDDSVSDVVRALSLMPHQRMVVAVESGRWPVAGSSGWRRLARDLAVAQRIRVVPITSRRALRNLVDEVGLLVSTPRVRPQRNLVVAALWSGTPVVISDLAGARDLVESGTSGLVVPPADPRHLARVLNVAVRDASSRSVWAWTARRRALEVFAEAESARAVSEVLATAGSPGWAARRRRSAAFGVASAG